jgi:hypothetical protein
MGFDRPCRTQRPSCQSPAASRFSIQAVALTMPSKGNEIAACGEGNGRSEAVAEREVTLWRFLLSGLLNICGLILLFAGSLDDPMATLRELYSALVITQAPATQAATAPSLNDAEQIVPVQRRENIEDPAGNQTVTPLQQQPVASRSPSVSIVTLSAIAKQPGSVVSTGAQAQQAASPAIPIVTAPVSHTREKTRRSEGASLASKLSSPGSGTAAQYVQAVPGYVAPQPNHGTWLFAPNPNFGN